MARKKKDKKADVAATESESCEAASEQPDVEPVDEMQAERDDLLARLQRLAADYQNYQKRSAKDLAQAREYANESLVKEFLPVLDDMERALDAARENHGEDDPLFVGMQLVHDKALEVLGRFGLAVISATGEAFDPDRHAALMQEESPDTEPMTVLRELQRGYQFKDRTIRPSSVVVSQATDESPEAPTDEPQES